MHMVNTVAIWRRYAVFLRLIFSILHPVPSHFNPNSVLFEPISQPHTMRAHPSEHVSSLMIVGCT
jgi:hypothetical protein